MVGATEPVGCCSWTEQRRSDGAPRFADKASSRSNSGRASQKPGIVIPLCSAWSKAKRHQFNPLTVAEMDELVGAGRAAEVFRHGPDRVLRRYRDGRDCTDEVTAMDWLRRQGLPVPLVELASDTGSMVMEFVSGQSMFEQLSAAPQGFVRHARTLAKLQRQINSIVAPLWFPERGVGAVVVHTDLHPMNVIYGPSGPVVIDWTNFGRGPASLDGAMTAVLVESFEVKQFHERAGRQLFLSAFSLFRGRSIVLAGMAEAAARRLKDPNITVGEQVVVAEMVHKHH